MNVAIMLSVVMLNVVAPTPLIPVADDGEIEDKIVGERRRPFCPSFVRANDDALLPIFDTVTNPFAEKWLHLLAEYINSLK